MSAELTGSDLDSVHEELAAAQLACSRLVSSARMIREGFLVPNWQSDVLEPAMRICAALCFVVDTLPPPSGEEASAES